MKYKPVDQYGLIGDMNSAALVGTDGSIDWCCFPRFDSPSVFAAILDGERGGSFRIASAASGAISNQEYVPGTNVLVTRVTTDIGTLTLTDFMPLADSHFSGPCPHEVHRIVRCTTGSVRVRCAFASRLGYGRAATIFAPLLGGVTARGGRQALSLVSHIRLVVTSGGAEGEFTLAQDDEATFVLAYGHGRPAKPESYNTHRKLRQTVAASVTYDGMWREQVVHSFLVLHLMVYEPTGAIIAAPTASLPETSAALGIGATATRG